MATSDSPLIVKRKDKAIDQYKEFKYLMTWIESDDKIDKEIKRTI